MHIRGLGDKTDKCIAGNLIAALWAFFGKITDRGFTACLDGGKKFNGMNVKFIEKVLVLNFFCFIFVPGFR